MIFKNKKLKAGTALTVLVAFGWMTAGGNAWAESRAAKRDPGKALARMASNPHLAMSPEQKLQARLLASAIESQPQAASQEMPVDKPVRILAAHAGTDPAAEMRAIAAEIDQLDISEKRTGDPETATRLKSRLEAAHKKVLRDFAQTESLLRKANLPKVIFERHNAARADYMEKIQAVFQEMDAAGKSQNPAQLRSSLQAASELLSKSTDERPTQAFDPSQMPFRMAKPTERKPFVPKRKAGAGGKAAAVVTEKLVAPTAADLAANEDVQITPEIQELATSLGNQPLPIYNWVRNNIEFVPTQGSIQGAQMTLEAKRGNAYDISSLLIALLRSAGVHAKYVTGTTEVPLSAVMNWVGGAETSQVAQQILGQGGIPNVALVSSGTVTHIRIEHVWVEAFIDYIPSRGALHRVGDTWVPMDAAFKQHTFTPRSDLYTENPISVVLDPGDRLFDLDESLGKVTNVDAEPMENRLREWAVRSEEYFLANGRPANMEDLLGRQTIIQENKTTFPGSLPYAVLVRNAGVSTLPTNLRHYVTLNGFDSDFDRALGDPSFSVKLSLPELNSRRLSLQFEPATQADADTLQAARDSGASSLPVYLVNVVPVIKLDGVERGRGGGIRMGSFYPVDVVLQAPDGPTTIPYRVVAGDEIVVGVTGNGVDRKVIEKRFAANPVNNASEYLHLIQLNYWMECDVMGNATASGHGVHALRLPSVGFFSSPLSVSYIFGAPRSGVYQGNVMDVKQSLLGPAGTDPAKVTEFMKQAGTAGSYLEGALWDQFRDRTDPGPRGVSSIHILQAAMSQGIPIYHITSANSAAVLPLLQLNSAVESDIATAVSQGKTVLTPERNVNLGAWTGVGYIIQDDTGGGAYLISGGLSGGTWLDCLRELLPSWETVLQWVIALAIVAAIIGAIATAPVSVPAYAAVALVLLLIAGLSGLNSSPGPVEA
ncbi:MAG TPA: transglutaminase-like domain-containing protein [Thermoanaerobaculia bacterium]